MKASEALCFVLCLCRNSPHPGDEAGGAVDGGPEAEGPVVDVGPAPVQVPDACAGQRRIFGFCKRRKSEINS